LITILRAINIFYTSLPVSKSSLKQLLHVLPRAPIFGALPSCMIHMDMVYGDIAGADICQCSRPAREGTKVPVMMCDKYNNPEINRAKK